MFTLPAASSGRFHLPQLRDDPRHILRGRGSEGHGVAGVGVEDGKRSGMEHLTGDHIVVEPGRLCAAVDPVAEDRMADVRHVYADLVRSAGLDLHFNERRVLESLPDLEHRARLARLFRLSAYSFPLFHMPAERRIDRARAFPYDTHNE